MRCAMPMPDVLDEVFDHYRQVVMTADPYRRGGRVIELIGLVIEARGPQVGVGARCDIERADGSLIAAEVVGFREGRTLLMPLGDPAGIAPGQMVIPRAQALSVPVGGALLGRVLDGLGRPLDDGPPLIGCTPAAIQQAPPDALQRPAIDQQLDLGVRALDALIPCGRGQRLGIFAGSGVGKSTMLGMMARHAEADVNVIALVGERGREVREFLDRDLGPEGLARSVVIVATSDQPALVRIKAALVATTIAEWFRDQGSQVLLMMDSVTRLAMAQREVGLAIGEPPATRGYTPSVFALLPRLLERAGASRDGTITGLYTVLVEGDDMNEPVADTVRGILDGHIVLSRELAHRHHYPAIDILQSVSRLAPQLLGPAELQAGARLRELLSAYARAEDLIDIGAYVPGSDPVVDEARARMGQITRFLQQGVNDPYDPDVARQQLLELVGASPIEVVSDE